MKNLFSRGTPEHRKESGSELKGVLCGAFAAMTYGMNPLFTLPLYRIGMNPDTVLFYRYVFAAVLLAGLIGTGKQGFRLKKRMIAPVAGCGILIAFSSLCLFQSYLKMDAGIASTILFVYPVMVAVIMGGFFHEKITWRTSGGILAALGGVAILYHGGGSGKGLNPVGLLLVLGSALSYAVYMVAIRESRVREVPPETLNFYVMAFGAPVFFLQAGFCGGIQWIPTLSGWGCALALGLLPTVFSFVAMTVSIRIIGATKTAVLGALEPLTAVLIGVLLFGEKLTAGVIAGILVILFSVTAVVTGGTGKRTIHFRKRS